MRRFKINTTLNNLQNFSLINERAGNDERLYIYKNNLPNNNKLKLILDSFPEYRNNKDFLLTNTGLIAFQFDNNTVIIYDLLASEEKTLDEIEPDVSPISTYNLNANPLAVRKIKFEVNLDGSFFLPKFLGVNVKNDSYQYQYQMNSDYLNGQEADSDGLFRFTSDNDLFVNEDIEVEEDDLFVSEGFDTTVYKWFTPGYFYKQQFIITVVMDENNIMSEGLHLYMQSGSQKFYPKKDGNNYIFDFTNYPDIATDVPFNIHCTDSYYKTVRGYMEVR